MQEIAKSPILALSPLSNSVEFIKRVINLDAVSVEANHATERHYEYINLAEISSIDGIRLKFDCDSQKTHQAAMQRKGHEEWRFWTDLELEGLIHGTLDAYSATLTFKTFFKMHVSAQIDAVGRNPTGALIDSYATLSNTIVQESHDFHYARNVLPGGACLGIHLDAVDILQWRWFDELKYSFVACCNKHVSEI
jgi:hypothetical protein